MSMDDTTINSAATWAAVQEGRASWGEWVETRLAERLGEERSFASGVLAEVLGTLAGDLRDELTKAIASLRAQRSLEVAGTYDPTVCYRALDVVALNGASFAARVDSPKQCPGSDWQLVAAQGKAGRPGAPGADGKNGKDAPRIVDWLVNRETYCCVPVMSDGSRGAVLELRPLFARFFAETEGTPEEIAP
jgi:hypothetical protein